MNHREIPFEIKSVSEKGEFEGIAAVYGNVDLGGDRIEKGAFTKTFQENGGRVPLLADHRIPIGASLVTDSEEGMRVKGILNLEKQVARDIHSDLKFYQEHGITYGMSIGYDTVQSKRDGDVRVLKELKLYETSTTLFPMNPLARVEAVKSLQKEMALPVLIKSLLTTEQKDFASSLDAIKTWALTHQLFRALEDSLAVDVLYPYSAISRDDRLANADKILTDFHAAYMEFLPKLLDMWGVKDAQAPEVKSFIERFAKAGRRISSQTRREIESAIATLTALLEEAVEDDTSGKAAAQPTVDEPVLDHSQVLTQIKSKLQECF